MLAASDIPFFTVVQRTAGYDYYPGSEVHAQLGSFAFCDASLLVQ